MLRVRKNTVIPAVFFALCEIFHGASGEGAAGFFSQNPSQFAAAIKLLLGSRKKRARAAIAGSSQTGAFQQVKYTL